MRVETWACPNCRCNNLRDLSLRIVQDMSACLLLVVEKHHRDAFDANPELIAVLVGHPVA